MLENKKFLYENYLSKFDNEENNFHKIINKNKGCFIINGNIITLKNSIKDLSSALFQMIKQLSNMRLKGLSVPQNILLVSLNDCSVYLYDAQDYFNDIHNLGGGK